MGTQRPTVRQIGKYVVLDVIGTGGMGIVYRAQDLAIGRTVAIKMLRPRNGDGTTGVFDRFLVREMKSTGNLHHRNIVTVYDSGEQDGSPYLVMEYLEGDPVSKLISDQKQISLLDKLDVIVQVCDGLQYAHDRNVIHRDIKPANVIVLPDGTAKLVDFGIARIGGSDSSLVQTGQIVGSLSYMSPEQVNSLPLDGRSDIFSTGVMLYELLTYEVPFKGNDPSSTFVRILREDPLPLSHFIPGVPQALQIALNRALAKNVQDRYQSAEEFGFDLLGIQRDLKSSTVADSLKRAEAAMQRGDLERVRILLQDVIRLDRHNDPANRLLREVRQTLQQQQRSSQIGQIRSQAQVALAGGQFEEALACADQALRLDTTDAESIRLCEQIRDAISRAKAVRQSVNRAEGALFAGDFDEAKDAIEESLRLDPSDSEARALATMINKELAERSRRAQVQSFVDEARRGIADRKFTDAIDALHRAEELDPTDSNVRELLNWAQRGQEQEDRRRYLQEITDQIENALHGGDFSSACTISEMGLQRFPDEPTLLRLRVISEKQRDIAERRRFVHDQGLAVKSLTEQDKLLDAVQLLTESLRKYPGEPNLESLLAITKAAIERQQAEREESTRKKALQRAEAEARAQLTQRVLSWSIELRRALDGRAALADVLKNSKELRLALEGKQIDDHARDVAGLVLSEVNGRIRARDQAIIELEQLQRAFKRSVDLPSLSEVERRLLSVKAAFPNEPGLQEVCSNLTDAVSRAREERNQCISQLDELTQTVETTPTIELTALRERANKLAAGAAGDPRVGALLQQIDFSINRRSERHTELLRDIDGLIASLSKVQSLDDIARICDRGGAIAALDPTDDELGERSRTLQAEAQSIRTSMEALLDKMAVLARTIANAKNVHKSEKLVLRARELVETRPDFQDLQEAATRVFAEVQGQRIEHDLIVQELEAGLAAIPLVETDEELAAAALRARRCLDLHQSDTTILTLSNRIVDRAESILRERTELRLRQEECDNALLISEEKLRDRDLDGALSILLLAEEKNPDRVDLHVQITILRRAIEQRQEEQDRLEQERIERERAEAEARARRAAIAQSTQRAQELLHEGQSDESLQCLRSALEREPGNEELESALESTIAEIFRQGEERERLERERIAREQADAEVRARKAAAAQAVRESRELLTQRQEEESLQRLRDALDYDPENPDLRSALQSTQAEVALRRAERERQERERLEHERIAREKAEAEARALEATRQAIRQAQELLSQGQEEASLQTLRTAMERYPESPDLHSALESIEADVARLRKERETHERKRREAAAKQTIAEARELMRTGQSGEAMQRLGSALASDPESRELRTALATTQEEVVRVLAEKERLEQQRIARENAEAEARARKAAAEKAIQESRQLLAQGRDDESVRLLSSALKDDPQSQELRSTLDTTQAEVGRRREERERQERARVARQKAEAEALARKAAADQAIREATAMLARGRGEESVHLLRTALQRDSENQELQSSLASAEAEVARLRAERERLEQERQEKDRQAREKAEAEARARKAAAAQAIQDARELFDRGQEQESLERLRSALERDPESRELRSTLTSAQAEIARRRAEWERLERERLERERVEREQAEAETRARKAAADQAIKDARKLLGRSQEEESLERLRAALGRDPENRELRSALESIQGEVARLRAERERVEREQAERERIAREKAETEARARKAAADKAINQARDLAVRGQGEDAVRLLQSALEIDPTNRDLRSTLDSIQNEVVRLRAERERQERERARLEKLAKDKAEAEARARKTAVELAFKEARELLGKGRGDDAVQRVRAALERDPENQELQSALEWIQGEVVRQAAERERLERQRLERERVEQENAAAEARARRVAADKAIKESRALVAEGRGEEGVQRLKRALEKDPKNASIRAALDSIQSEIAAQRAEQKELERKRAKEKAAADALARKAEAEKKKSEAARLAAATEKATKESRPARPSEDKLVSGQKHGIVIGAAAAAVLVLGTVAYFVFRHTPPPPPPSQTVTSEVKFSVEPADSALTVDGISKSCGGECSLPLTPGRHNVRLEKQGFVTKDIEITVAKPPDPNDTVSLVLAPPPIVVPGEKTARLDILSSVDAGSVTLDRDSRGNLPGPLRLGDLNPGPHQIVVSQHGQKLTIQTKVSNEGVFSVDWASSPNQVAVVSATQIGNEVSIYCRCFEGEVLIDGKKPKPAGRDRFSFNSQGKTAFNLTVQPIGNFKPILINVADATHAAIHVEPFVPIPDPEDLTAWKLVKDSKDLNALRQFVANHPTSTFAVPANESIEAISWESVQGSDKIADFKKFVADFPNGPHFSDANEKIAQLGKVATPAPAPVAKDVAEWNGGLKDSKDLNALRQFRERYFTSPFARSAYERMDDISWDAVKNSSQISELQKFVADYREGRHVSDANARIQELERQVREAILQVLEDYRSAYERKDLKALQQIWPKVPTKQFQNAFADAEKISAKIADCQKLTVSGDTAAISCKQSLLIKTVGNKFFAPETVRHFSLIRSENRWVIEGIN